MGNYKDFLYGADQYGDDPWVPGVDDIIHATYGDPDDAGAPPPLPGTKYGKWGPWPGYSTPAQLTGAGVPFRAITWDELGWDPIKWKEWPTGAETYPTTWQWHAPGTGSSPANPVLIYGKPEIAEKIPFQAVPEDARAIVIESYPYRVNHARNPCFAQPVNDRTHQTWLVKGGTIKQVTSDCVFTDHALEMSPSTQIRFGNFGYPSTAIWVSPNTLSGSSGTGTSTRSGEANYWKFSLMTKADRADYVRAGFYVRYRDGSTKHVPVRSYPEPLPWMKEPEATALTLRGETRVTTDGAPPSPAEIHPSVDDWYALYGVADLGRDAVWALPTVQTSDAAPAATVITALCIERWESIHALKGPGLPIVTPGRWIPRDLMKVDGHIFFDGDYSYRGVSDYVWMGDPAKSVTGYYPQKSARTEGLRTLMRGWLPIGRTLSVQYVVESP